MAVSEVSEAVTATCHCGAVSITLATSPAEITHCNCSLCRTYGVLWAYYPMSDVTISARMPTQTYAWNGKNVDFHRCANCGCVTHWWPRRAGRDRLGVNARLLAPGLVSAATIHRKDAAGTGLFH